MSCKKKWTHITLKFYYYYCYYWQHLIITIINIICIYIMEHKIGIICIHVISMEGNNIAGEYIVVHKLGMKLWIKKIIYFCYTDIHYLNYLNVYVIIIFWRYSVFCFFWSWWPVARISSTTQSHVCLSLNTYANIIQHQHGETLCDSV